MASDKPVWAKVTGAILDLLQIAIALSVIILTSWKLLNVDVNISGEEGPKFDTGCVLDGPNSSGSLSGVGFCVYAIAVGVISLLVNTIFGCIRNIFKCVTCNVCAASRVIAIIGDVALAVWWAVAFALFLRRGGEANDAGFPNRSARDGVIALAFGGIVAFGVDVFVTLFTIVKS